MRQVTNQQHSVRRLDECECEIWICVYKSSSSDQAHRQFNKIIISLRTKISVLCVHCFCDTSYETCKLRNSNYANFLAYFISVLLNKLRQKFVSSY